MLAGYLALWCSPRPEEAPVRPAHRSLTLVTLLVPLAWVAGSTVAQAAEPVTPADLSIETVPSGAEITVDGRSVGRSPIRGLRLPPGAHVVVGQDRCHSATTRDLTLKAGEVLTEKITLTPRPAGLLVEAVGSGGNDLPAEILLDGKRLGEAWSAVRLPMCAEAVQVRHAGYVTQLLPVSLGERRTSRVHVTLQAAAPGALAAAPRQKLPAEAPDDGLIPASMPTTGQGEALVTIIELADFQCPFCVRVSATLKEVLPAYGDEVRLVWANNPLSFHPRARPAALAALAAHRQGGFWAMHERLMAHQRELTDANFAAWAQDIGLDVDQWRRDLADPALETQITREQQAAKALGANGTPSFFINGLKLSGAQPAVSFRKAIDEALALARKQRAQGKTGRALIEAAFAERSPTQGRHVAAWLLDGVIPPASAAPPTTRPAKLPDDTVWNVPIEPDDAVEGHSGRARVTLVEFTDFQCPFCARAVPTIDALRKKYGDQLRVVFKQHPLPFHKDARPAHHAAIAAGRQGKYAQYRARLFANQRKLQESDLRDHARELGLNMKRFDRDRRSPAAEAQVTRDLALARRVGITGTPSFMINGRKLVGAQRIEAFEAIIDAEIARSRAAGRQGEGWYQTIIAKGRFGK